jgi:cell division protein FtsB
MVRPALGSVAMAKRSATVMGVVLGGAIVYLGAHALTGHQGLLAYVDLQAQERVLEQQVEDLEEERAELEARAARLKPETLDLDYLDERARITLAAGASDELVFAVN